MGDSSYNEVDVIRGIRKDLEWLVPAVKRARISVGQRPTMEQIRALSVLYLEIKAAHRQLCKDMKDGLSLEDAAENLNESQQRFFEKVRKAVDHRILTAVFNRKDYDAPIDPEDIKRRANRFTGLDF